MITDQTYSPYFKDLDERRPPAPAPRRDYISQREQEIWDRIDSQIFRLMREQQ
jgi:hypothetical protein